MNDSLATSLNDHLSGADFAIDLLRAINDGKIKTARPSFVGPLLTEVERDRDTLQQFMDDLGVTTTTVKEVAGWFAEKAHRLKLAASGTEEFGEFEAMEFLTVGVFGKEKLWRALQAAASMDARLRKLDYDNLIERAKSQRAQIEGRRLELAATVFAPSAS